MTKIVIPNDDPDNPEDTREVRPLGLDLADDKQAGGGAFNDAIQQAAQGAATDREAAPVEQKIAEAQAELEKRAKALADQVSAEFGLAETGHGISSAPRVYKKRPKEEYDLWKRIIPMFVGRPATLDMPPRKLVAQFCNNPEDAEAYRNRLYDKLNIYARRDLEKLLATLGITLALKPPVTIRSVQKQLLARRDAGNPKEEFTGRFVIEGDTAYVNGKPFKIQEGASGKRRIKRNGVWLVLDTVKTFCTD